MAASPLLSCPLVLEQPSIPGLCKMGHGALREPRGTISDRRRRDLGRRLLWSCRCHRGRSAALGLQPKGFGVRPLDLGLAALEHRAEQHGSVLGRVEGREKWRVKERIPPVPALPVALLPCAPKAVRSQHCSHSRGALASPVGSPRHPKRAPSAPSLG